MAAARLSAAITAAVALAGLAAAPTHAALALQPCPQSNQFACGSLSVPLDPSGVTPGSITLVLRRHRAPVGEPRSAVIALAGGPGQAAVPITEEFTEILGPVIARRDLIVFDQRGTGSSQPLSCHAFEANTRFRSLGAAISSCATQIGPSRAFYTSLDTVADIEAIRVAGGYEKLVLYGTSYGTKVAELYAEEHPEHVEALVLDSVVPPNGPEALNRTTFAAIPRVVRSLCARGVCAHVTREPLADLTRVLAKLRHGPLRARVIDGDGHAHSVAMHSQDLLGELVAGDLAPVLRAEFVTSVRAAADGDNAPLAALLDRGEAAAGEGIDLPLYFATTCEEELFPWNRGAPAAKRLAEAGATIRALPPSVTRPFRRSDMLALSDIPACAYWPFATPAPVVAAASLPNVPTLILSGAEDLRTPTANARSVAAQIPDAHVLVVPYTGHSVLTAEPTSCARKALLAQFAGRPIKPCHVGAPPPSLRPPPLPPMRLASVTPETGYSGPTGRTLHGLTLTLADVGRQLGLQLLEIVGSGQTSGFAILRSGGLRAGWLRYANGTLALHGYSYIPGMTISGTINGEEAHVAIGGSAAATGDLHLGHHHTLIGELDGEQVKVGTGELGSGVTSVAASYGESLALVPRPARTAGARVLAEIDRALAL